MTNILLVDDDDLFAGMVEKMVVRAGYVVVRARDGREGLRLHDPQSMALVLTDLVMPDMEGIELITELRRRHPAVRIVAMSGGGRNSPQSYLDLASRLGAKGILAKPFSNQELTDAIKAALK